MLQPENFKILIADDESFSRYAMKSIITKNIPEATICGEAQDGFEVCRKAGELKPDLILMDIKMPGMNGIDASEKIIAVHPDIKIIILSAYDYFNYAQKSLDIGVCSYLLKPFKEKQISEKIKSIIFDKSRSLNRNFPSTQHLPKDINKHLQNELLMLLINPWNNENKINELLHFLNLPETFSGIFICIGGESLSLHKKEWISSTILDRTKGVCSETHDSRLCILIFFEHTDQITLDQSGFNLESKLEDIKKTGSCNVGASRPSPRKMLPTAYRQAVLSMQLSEESGNAIIYSDDIAKDNQGIMYPFELEDKFIHSLEWEEFDTGWKYIEELCSLILNSFSIKSFQTEKLISLFLLMKKTSIKSGIYDPNFDEKFSLHAIGNFTDNNERVKFILDFFNSIEEFVKRKTSGNETRKTARAFQYIQQNIFTDISLEAAADYAEISPQHLSRQFKEKYNINFVEYLTQHRMNQAKYLLRTSGKNIKEISSEVGYTDPNYFSRVFRKFTGRSPLQYRVEAESPPEFLHPDNF